jgi:hypothetical protein
MPVSECCGKRLPNRLIDMAKKNTHWKAAKVHICRKDAIFNNNDLALL